MYKVVLTKQSAKSLQRMPRNVANQILEKIDRLAENPFAENKNVTKLQNRPGYRLRVGDWRIIFDLQVDESVLLVIKIATRGEIYR